jgi:sn-glycerol 3-phosphate transport system substrate-binding protein
MKRWLFGLFALLSVAFAQSKVTITFWYGLGGNLGQIVQQFVQRFNETHPNIEVKALYQGSYSGGGPEQQKILAAIASGSVPDIAQMEANSLPPFANSGALLPLETLMAQSGVKPSEFLPGMLLSGQWDGHQYAIPFNRSVPVLIYNTAMFKAAGLNPNDPPKTWPELAQDAMKLTHGSGSNKVYGFMPIVDWWFWESYTLSACGHILNANRTQALFAQPVCLKPLEIQQDLVKQGYAQVISGSNYWDGTITAFAHGMTAMYPDSVADFSTIEAQAVPSVKGQWRAAFMPTMPGHKLVVPPGGGNLVIFKNIPASHIKAAWTFILWAIQPEQQAWWSMHTGYMPVTKAAVQTQVYQAYLKANPNARVPLEELNYQGAMPLNTHYLQMLQAVQQGLQGVFDQLQPPSTTMEQVARRVDEMMSQ